MLGFNNPDGIYNANSVLLTTLVDNTFSHGLVGLYDFYSPGTSFSNLSISGFVFPNAVPTDIALSQSTIEENSANGSVVGDLTGFDPDANEPLSFSIIDNPNEIFAISGTYLVLVGELDYEVAISHDITVRVTNSTSNTFDKTFAIDVTNVPGVTITGTNSANVIDATHTVAGQPLPTNEEDTINAGGGNDTINALGGDDFINGGAGADRMFGGTGNDTYVADSSRDIVNETGGNGLDTVQSSVTFSLSDVRLIL